MGFCWHDVADSALSWEAKELNFDTHSYDDSVFLIPHGVRATAEFATIHGLHDLAAWMDNDWIGDPDEAAARWRETSFFSRVPPASAPSAELAAWLRQE